MKYKGFIIGFIFGIVGLGLLAVLALIMPFFEAIGNFLFAPGRALAAAFVGAEGSNLAVVLLTLANGVLYGLIGALIEYIYRKQPRTSARKH